MSAARELRRQITLPVDRARAWDAISDPALLSRWLAPEVELEMRPAGTGHIRDEGGSLRHILVESVDPPRQIVFHWTEADGVGPCSTVTIELSEAQGTTVVTVSERVLEPGDVMPDMRPHAALR